MLKKLTIEDFRIDAKIRGGVCLSEVYTTANPILKFRCAEGHQWETNAKNIRKGNWCPVCGRNLSNEKKRLTIEEMQKIAEAKRGRCLSKKYKNTKSKLLWECSKGHQWKAKPHDIKKGHWCPVCWLDKRRLTIKDMQVTAEARGGKCLSEEYVNTHTKLIWQCKYDHSWEAKPNNIRNGKWCPVCARNLKLTIEDMQKVAKARGGKCLSKDYVNSQTKLKWQCKKGHIWEAVPHSVRVGSWCSFCGENRTRLTLKDMQEIAEERGGTCLSEIYINVDTKLKWQCKEGHIWESAPCVIRNGSWCPKCAIDRKRLDLEEIKKIIESKGGEFLSKEYINSKEKIKIKCMKGHTFLSSAVKVNNGIWCPKCAINNMKLPAEEMYMIAESKGGRCLSKEYINNRTKLKWQCKEEHMWYAPLSSVKGNPKKKVKGTWCPECAIKAFWSTPKLTIEEMQILAMEKNGLCLSDKYINSATKLTWQCEKGHIFKKRPNSIKRGHWCPYCSRRKKLTIEEMRGLAKKKGGKCLSDKYINAQIKLKWQCKEGHVWESSPQSVKYSDSWCPHCAKIKGAEKRRRIKSERRMFISQNPALSIQSNQFLHKIANPKV